MATWGIRLSLALASCALLLASTASRAQTYPDHTIRFIVPFGAGGPTDVYTRALAEELRKVFNQPVVMDNRPGAGTVIGTTEASKAAPDGYTLLMVSATQTVAETLNQNKPYKLMRDFVPVAALQNAELVMVVHPVGAGEDAAGVYRAREGQSRKVQLRLVRPRLELSHGGRTREKHHWHQHCACAVQGQHRRAQ